jgi:beta-fructofuranosidase
MIPLALAALIPGAPTQVGLGVEDASPSYASLKSLFMDEREDLLKGAEAAVKLAIPKAEADLTRPGFHFRAPAQWMNDPNGPIYYGGWYHLFYQFNPYGDQWGNMHWGHARSKDLVDWEHLPIALWPTKSKGEDHIFSGSTFLDANGRPVIFYTSIGNRAPEQWIARPSDDTLVQWFKPSSNPVLTEKHHGATKIEEWRDPFLFAEAGATYMLLGGRHEGKGSVELYKSENPDLTRWHFEGVLFHHPNSNLIECPNIAKLGDKWLLLTSHDGRVDWFVGSLDLTNHSFAPANSGILAEGSYASQLMRDKAGKLIHFAWIPTNDHKGWNGYLALPSTLELDGVHIVRKPLAALRNLRRSTTRHQVEPGTYRGSDSLEIELQMLRGSSVSFNDVKIEFDGKKLSVSGRQPYFPASDSIKVRIFVDHSALDVYADDGRYSVCLRRPEDSTLRISGEVRDIKIHSLRPSKLVLPAG